MQVWWTSVATFQRSVQRYIYLEVGNRSSQQVVRRASTSQQQSPPQRATGQSCAGCGGVHPRVNCRFRSAMCRLCRKVGHISTVCRSRPAVRPAEVAGQQQRAEPTSTTHMVSDSEYSVFALSGNGVHSCRCQVDEMSSCPPIIVPINVDGIQVLIFRVSPCHLLMIFGHSQKGPRSFILLIRTWRHILGSRYQ